MNYRNVINKTLEYIEANLTEPIYLDDVASEAHLSPFHFHRSFQALVGDCLGEYIRKRRLTRAAEDLIESDLRIIEIAVKYQYNSQSTFNRAFKRFHMITPGKCRKDRLIPCAYGRANIKRNGVCQMQPQIIMKKPLKIVGVELRTTTVDNANLRAIPEFWQECRVQNVIGRIPNKVKPEVHLGICADGNEDGSFTYIVGALVENYDDVPDDMVARTIPEAKYAVFTSKGKLPESVQKTWRQIYDTWLSGSEYERADTEDFEWYDERSWALEEPEVDIYIPLK